MRKVVGMAVTFKPKKSLENKLLTKVVGKAVIFNPKNRLCSTTCGIDMLGIKYDLCII